jgi:hypothetical protein
MKRLLLLTLLVALVAHAGDAPNAYAAPDSPTGDQRVLVFFDHGPRFDYPLPSQPRGAIVPYEKARAILYVDVPCKMPIVGRKHWRRYADMAGLGCWAPTIDGGYNVVSASDGVTRHMPFLEASFEFAIFHIPKMTFEVIKEDAVGMLTFGGDDDEGLTETKPKKK